MFRELHFKEQIQMDGTTNIGFGQWPSQNKINKLNQGCQGVPKVYHSDVLWNITQNKNINKKWKEI